MADFSANVIIRYVYLSDTVCIIQYLCDKTVMSKNPKLVIHFVFRKRAL